MWVSKALYHAKLEAAELRIADLKAEIAHLREMVRPTATAYPVSDVNSEADAVLGAEQEIRYTEQEVAQAEAEQSERDRYLSGNYDQGNE